jgi:predicted amidophosphoribosyltransferase
MTTNEAELSAVAHPWGRGLRRALAALADLLLPPVCISCRKQTLAHGLLCGACWSRIDFIAPPICARLGVPLPYDTGETALSAAAIAEPPVYDRARAAARYSATMRDLIQSFKYGDRHEGVALFGRWMDGRRRPPCRSRRDGAGAALPLAVVVAAFQPIGHVGARRVTAQRRPRRLFSARACQAYAEPGRALAGAFRVLRPRAELLGKRVVVVDDVITTGATADACARILKRGGAARVDVLALARAVEPTALLL